MSRVASITLSTYQFCLTCASTHRRAFTDVEGSGGLHASFSYGRTSFMHSKSNISQCDVVCCFLLRSSPQDLVVACQLAQYHPSIAADVAAAMLLAKNILETNNTRTSRDASTACS